MLCTRSAERVELGRMSKRLIDQGRVAYMQAHVRIGSGDKTTGSRGTCGMVHYCSRDTTVENAMLVAS